MVRCQCAPQVIVVADTRVRSQVEFIRLLDCDSNIVEVSDRNVATGYIQCMRQFRVLTTIYIQCMPYQQFNQEQCRVTSHNGKTSLIRSFP